MPDKFSAAKYPADAPKEEPRLCERDTTSNFFQMKEYLYFGNY